MTQDGVFLALIVILFFYTNSHSWISRKAVFRWNNGITLLQTSSKFIENEDNHQMTSMGTTLDNKMQKKRGDNRNSLPFLVVDTLGVELGTFSLDASTTNGDFLDLGHRGIYKVKKVIFLYRYKHGSFVVYQKKLEVVQEMAPSLAALDAPFRNIGLQ
eukprot:gene4226-4642_t